MKIIKLTAENVKRLKAIEITPEGNMIVVGGENDQGKTSVLDSIAMAIGGGKYIPGKPVRKGADKAVIIAETEDLIITRTITKEGGGALRVGTKEGMLYQSPQTVLDALTGQLTFDPLVFSSMKTEKQLETLKMLVGLDFSKLETERACLYDERTDVNREGKRLAGALESMPVFPDAPNKPIIVSELMNELAKRQAHNHAIENAEAELNDYQAGTAEFSADIEVINKAIKESQRQLAEQQKRLIACKQTLKSRGVKETLMEGKIGDMTPANLEEITAQVTSADHVNNQIRANEAKAKVESRLTKLRAESGILVDNIANIDSDKEKQLSEATFPIEGLSFDATGVLFNDIPWDQLSSSEQLKISTAMGFAMNPKLKVLLIRDGSLLDDRNLKLLAEMAKKEDAQIWVERVGEGQEVSVIIEDGEVKNAS